MRDSVDGTEPLIPQVRTANYRLKLAAIEVGRMSTKHLMIIAGLLFPVSACAPPGGAQATVAASAPASAQTYDSEGIDFGVGPTTAIRNSDYDEPTPTIITGATTISTPQLQSMLASPKPPILIDVLGGDVTASLPGAIWLRGAGFGKLAQGDLQAHLATALTKITDGDKSRPIAFFCLSKLCWLSHNAAVRAVNLGYTNVLWYRGGRNAWRAAGLPLMPVKPTDI